MAKIKSKAKSNIEILGYQPDSVMLEHMQNAKAFVFAAEEDFGITPRSKLKLVVHQLLHLEKVVVLRLFCPYGVNKTYWGYFPMSKVFHL